MRTVLLLALILVCAAALPASPPTAIAIRDARVVTVSGPVLERGTVVIRNGLIEQAGADAAIPADAWIIEGKGLTVYPGLIDALSTLGLPEFAPQERPQRAGGGTPPGPSPTPSRPETERPPARSAEDRPSFSGWVRAADELKTSDRRIETARNLGFTTAVSFPTRNIFAGQGAVIDLAGEKPGDMVVATPAGMYLTLETARGMREFPSSLMGALAYIRQVALDAEHYRIEQAYYDKSHAGRKRPAYDRAIEAYLEAPRLLLPASSDVEIPRMLRFSADLKAPVVLYGGQAAYAEADALKQAGVPILVSLKWPVREKDADPEQEDSLRTLEFRDRAPSTPAVLAKAGVKFAFYTDNVASRDLKTAVKKALDAGLTEEELVRAMTLSPAEIYNVADRMGSIEKGKIANLVVTDGPLFGEKTKVKYIFVDGEKFEPPAEAEPAKEEAK